LKHSDLPDAVPVVTIVGPSQAASSASAWCCQSDSIPFARSAASSAGCSVSGSGAEIASRAPSKASCTSRSSARPASSSALQGWV
jgi:hypothetical protein